MPFRYALALAVAAMLVPRAAAAQQPADSTLRDVLVTFADWPDLSAADALATKTEKGAYVYAALRQHGARYDGLLARLIADSVHHEYLWAAGALYVARADSALVDELARRDDVACVADALGLRVDDPAEELAPTIRPRSAAPEWGLRFMRVPEVWDLGIRGEGAVVGGQDTGYDWDHPALRRSYRGYDAVADSATHDYHWYDAIEQNSPLNDPGTLNPCGYRTDEPCDDGSHGTHTLGTIVGEEGANQIGVAPEADWVACRSMERGWGRPETYLRCFQWFLAPTDTDGETPRPELAPDVFANSWYCPLQEGCDTCTYPAFDRAVGALRSAGVVVVASAGNAGRGGCNTVNQVPALAPGAISVAAHDSTGAIAAFSSRGDYLLPGRGPTLAAPGVAVRSSVPDSAYRVFSGTSMAGPHVVGVVALMISANPALRGQVDSIEAILVRTATPVPLDSTDACSDPVGDYQTERFGAGRVDALAAVQAAQAYSGGPSGLARPTARAARLWPNPASASVTLELPRAHVGARLEVYDAAGRLVLARRVPQRRTTLLTEAWPAGTYAYRVVAADALYAGRLLVRHGG